jgi:FlaG/FlaF family flagellin (archaellin)
MIEKIILIALCVAIIVVLTGLVYEVYGRNRTVEKPQPKRYVVNDGHYTEANPRVGHVNPAWYTPRHRR